MNAITIALSTVAFALGICLGGAAGWMIGYSVHMACIKAKLCWNTHKEKKTENNSNHD